MKSSFAPKVKGVLSHLIDAEGCSREAIVLEKQLKACAKINLGLRVTGRRKDGYHELSSLVVFVDVADCLNIRMGALSSNGDEYALVGPFSSCLKGTVEDNLIFKAVTAFKRVAPVDCAVQVTLEKNLPVASGVGGGSSDAAAVLLLLNSMTDCSLSANDLKQIALDLGADVPMCLDHRPKWVSGVGERIEYCDNLPELFAVLVNPGRPVMTAEIFKAFKEGGAFFSPPFAKPKSAQEWKAWFDGAFNDLYEVAVQLSPEMAKLIELLEASDGNIYASMSGSGATCFGLYACQQKAEGAFCLIKKKYPEYWVALGKIMGGV